MKLNIANKLTLARIVLVPFFAFFIIYPVFTYEHTTWSRIIAAAIFILAAITDFLDGKIARKKQIITHFGKFMDPLADKFMIFGALIAICASDFIIADDLTVPHWLLYNVFLWSTLAVVFRELAVTSMRLVVSRESGVVVAGQYAGQDQDRLAVRLHHRRAARADRVPDRRLSLPVLDGDYGRLHHMVGRPLYPAVLELPRPLCLNESICKG